MNPQAPPAASSPGFPLTCCMGLPPKSPRCSPSALPDSSLTLVTTDPIDCRRCPRIPRLVHRVPHAARQRTARQPLSSGDTQPRSPPPRGRTRHGRRPGYPPPRAGAARRLGRAKCRSERPQGEPPPSAWPARRWSSPANPQQAQTPVHRRRTRWPCRSHQQQARSVPKKPPAKHGGHLIPSKPQVKPRRATSEQLTRRWLITPQHQPRPPRLDTKRSVKTIPVSGSQSATAGLVAHETSAPGPGGDFHAVACVDLVLHGREVGFDGRQREVQLSTDLVVG